MSAAVDLEIISDASIRDLAGKYLTFILEGEEYGIGILQVREIIGVVEITIVPQTPDYIKGVINLRGRVVPVLDLRLKFNMEAREYNERTCIIVVEVYGEEGGSIQVGMVVDSVSEVLTFAPEMIEPPPAFGTDIIDAENILGMAKLNGQVKILIDVEKIIGSGVIQQFS